jgi:hypothetical protein
MSTLLALIYWFVVIAVVINFVNLAVGLLSAVTGRSYMPGPLRRMQRQEAASADDQRVLGMSLILLSVGQLLMMVTLLVVITLSAASSSGGHAPIVGLYLVTLVAFMASVACTFASLFIGRRARYSDVKRPEEFKPTVPMD